MDITHVVHTEEKKNSKENQQKSTQMLIFVQSEPVIRLCVPHFHSFLSFHSNVLYRNDSHRLDSLVNGGLQI